VRIASDEWWKIVEAVRKITGKRTPIWSCLVNYYSVCIPSVTTPLSRKLWYLYSRINGTQNETFESYQNLPAFWVDACDIIDGEITRIKREIENRAEQKQRQSVARLSRNKR
jgi:hypothetical protein